MAATFYSPEGKNKYVFNIADCYNSRRLVNHLLSEGFSMWTGQTGSYSLVVIGHGVLHNGYYFLL